MYVRVYIDILRISLFSKKKKWIYPFHALFSGEGTVIICPYIYTLTLWSFNLLGRTLDHHILDLFQRVKFDGRRRPSVILS